MKIFNDLISVIVPIYKVEPYLDRCVESIVNQTYKNLEIILVDDGSPDNCPAMCDVWAQKDCRIRVIHKLNGGLSDARNSGIAIATGAFIGFVDSDDWIATTMYEKLYETMKKNNCNMTACGIQLVDENGEESDITVTYETQSTSLRGEQAMRAVIEEKGVAPTVWNKLYRADCVKDIPFAVGKTHEDVFWTYQAVHASQSVVVIPDQLYFYVQRSSSIMNSAFSLRRLDALEGKQIRLEFIKRYYPSLVSRAKRDLLFFSLYLVQQSYGSKDRKIRHEVHTYVKKLIKNNKITFQEHSDFYLIDLVWLLSARFCLNLTCHMRNWLHVGI